MNHVLVIVNSVIVIVAKSSVLLFDIPSRDDTGVTPVLHDGHCDRDEGSRMVGGVVEVDVSMMPVQCRSEP